MLGDVVKLVQQPPDKMFGMLDWLASCVREKEGLPPLTLASLTPAQVDRALTAQEEAPQASAAYAALSDAPTSDPSLLHMVDIDDSGDDGDLAAAPVPPPRSNPTPPIPASVAAVSTAAPPASPPDEVPYDIMPMRVLPPPLDHTTGSGESLEAIEL